VAVSLTLGVQQASDSAYVTVLVFHATSTMIQRRCVCAFEGIGDPEVKNISQIAK